MYLFFYIVGHEELNYANLDTRCMFVFKSNGLPISKLLPKWGNSTSNGTIPALSSREKFIWKDPSGKKRIIKQIRLLQLIFCGVPHLN